MRWNGAFTLPRLVSRPFTASAQASVKKLRESDAVPAELATATTKVCRPGARLLYDALPEHDGAAPPSSWHVGVPPEAVKVKDAVAFLASMDWPVMLTVGGVCTTSKVAVT